MKKIVAIICSMIMVVIMASCSGGKDVSSAPSVSSTVSSASSTEVSSATPSQSSVESASSADTVSIDVSSTIAMKKNRKDFSDPVKLYGSAYSETAISGVSGTCDGSVHVLGKDDSNIEGVKVKILSKISEASAEQMIQDFNATSIAPQKKKSGYIAQGYKLEYTYPANTNIDGKRIYLSIDVGVYDTFVPLVPASIVGSVTDVNARKVVEYAIFYGPANCDLHIGRMDSPDDDTGDFIYKIK